MHLIKIAKSYEAEEVSIEASLKKVAIISLGYIAESPGLVIPELKNLIGGKWTKSIFYSMQYLAPKYPEKTVEEVGPLLSDIGREHRYLLIEVLGETKVSAKKYLPLIINALYQTNFSSESNVCLNAINDIGVTIPDEAIPLIVKTLSSDDQRGFEALRPFKRAAIPYLQNKAEETDDPTLKDAITEFLKTIQ